MARHSTGAWTVNQSLRIELSYLLKHHWIVKECVIAFSLNWKDQHGKNVGNISCKSSYLGARKNNYLELTYAITREGEIIHRNYKVYLCERESNLGNGMVLYFLCPQTGKKCRILYSAYGSDSFKARTSYHNRLYYDSQQASKLSRYNDAYWKIEHQLEKLQKISSMGTRRYKGELTQAAKRYRRLVQKQEKTDNLRWTIGAPKSMRAIFTKMDLL